MAAEVYFLYDNKPLTTQQPLERAFDIVPTAMCLLDGEGCIVRANYAFRNMFITEGAFEPVRELMRSLMSAGRSCGSLEQRLRCRDGRTLWARVTVTLVRNPGPGRERAVVVAEEVSGSVLSASRSDDLLRLRAVVEHSVDGIVMVNSSGMVTMANPAAERLLAPPGTSLVGTFFEGPPPNGRPVEKRVVVDGRKPRVVEFRGTITELHGEQTLIYNVRDITDLARMRDELRALSLLDDLTRLYNRRGFLTLGRQQLALADRTRRPLLVVLADLDGMKYINDTQGHAEGDRALKDMAFVFRGTFRKSDIVARIGGDEFAAITVEAALAGSKTIVSRFNERLRTLNSSGQRGYRLSASLGTVPYDPSSPCQIEELLERADSKMYEMKRARRAIGPFTI